MSQFVPPVCDDISEETAASYPFQVGVLQSLIEQTISGTMSVSALADRYHTLYQEETS